MREILFRGKCKKEGDWHFGYLFQTDSGAICILEKYVPLKELTYFEIDPETVCQYTGLTDKNGRKIFEGDCLGHELNVVEYMNGCFTVSGDRPLSLMVKYNEVIGNIFDKE